MSCMCKSVCMRGHKLSIFFKIWTSLFYVFRGEVCEDTLRDFLKNKLKIIDEIPFERLHRVGKTKRVQYQAKKHCRQVQLFQRPRTRPEASMPSFKPPPLVYRYSKYTAQQQSKKDSLCSSDRKHFHVRDSHYQTSDFMENINKITRI